MRPSGRSLLLALLASLVLHALALTLIHVPEGQAIAPDEAPIEVALAPTVPEMPAAAPAPPMAAAPQQRQMVAPPDEINDKAPEQARFESDRDNTVLHETVNPGVPHPAAQAAPPPPQRKAEPAPREKPAPRAERDSRDNDDAREAKAAPRQPAPQLDDLFAPTDELVRTQRDAEKAQHDAREDPAAAGRRRMALAVAPVTPEWSLPGHRGTFDFLPDIQRGDVTLLNTKANEFAPFVRRVGERVFQHLVIRQRALELQQIMNAHDPVEMRVTLDARGKLKSVHVESHSGSASMDDTLTEALNTAAFDNNPPKAAANGNGEFEFVFAAQLRAFAPGQGNVPSRIESRLSVGLL
ncbi:MAG TPA: TonB C-terminal domain-containing protein [Candidatus Binatia bacterium]|jgi:outer membrane biosynthesis protein TonB